MEKSRNAVRIFPHEGMWFVGCGAGFYNYPMSRNDALIKAVSLARERSEDEGRPCVVEVHDESGHVLEVLSPIRCEDREEVSNGHQSRVEPSSDRSGPQAVSHLSRSAWPGW